MSKKSGSSKRWLLDHARDSYVQAARHEGLRSRAGYKLLQIQEKFGLIETGHIIVDLGAAPGGFSQIARREVGREGRVVAVDLLEMAPLSGVEIIKGDFRENSTLDELINLINGQQIDLVISDMAPNISGVVGIDQPRVIYLAELALDMAKQALKPGGNIIFKVFQGEGFEQLLVEMRTCFAKVVTRKPAASRPRSREVYLVAKAYKH